MQGLFSFMDIVVLGGGAWACAVEGGAVPGSPGGDRNRTKGVGRMCLAQERAMWIPRGKY